VGFLALFVAGVFANPSNVGSLYSKWIQQILVEAPETMDNEITNPTVQRAHTLVDENGTEIARGAVSAQGQKVLLVGTDFSTEDTVRVYGADAKLKITATSGNPEISLGDTDGSHGSLYEDSDSGELRVWTGKKTGEVLNGQNAIEISGSGNDAGVNFSNELYAKGKKIVTTFSCTDENNNDLGLLIGFDADGNPLCSSDTNKTSWVSVPKAGKYVCSAECGGGTVDFEVSCRSGDDYSVEEDDQVCIDLGLEKPLETRACNTFACKEPVNGGWTDWENSGICGVFTGIQHQVRSCTNPSPFAGGDKRHLHDRLLVRGWSEGKIFWLYTLTSSLLGISVLLLESFQKVIMLFCFVIGFLVVRRVVG